MIGKTLSHYRVVEKIGAGGMGEVYRARDERLERDVALKVLPAGALADEATRKRFRKEALALSKLNHPNIETVHDFDTQDGIDFLVMEHIAGETLEGKLQQGPLPEKEVVRLAQQLADGLAAAHEQGVVHRDLKPGNLRLTPDGRLKILDFGLAKLLRADFGPAAATTTESLSETRGITGTLPYMAPEQLRSELADARTDIWAAGAVLYELATGLRPFRTDSAPGLTDAILHQVAVAPRAVNARISAELERIILKCLEKEPDHRYQSARELLADFRRLSTPSTASLTPTAEAAAVRLRLRLLLGSVLAVVVLMGGLFLGNVARVRDRLLGKPSPGRIESLAVLPLENLARDPEQDYFADGMTEALIADLAQISALRVISRTSVMQYKGVHKPLPQIAKELKVDAVVEGSVQRAGDRVRITAQLVRAVPEQHLWARSYERDLRDILALQNEVARAIASEIQVKLAPQEQARLASARPVNPAAHEAYLKGRYAWNNRTQDGLNTAIGYFNQALEKDPAYALAYAGLADAYSLMGQYGFLPSKEAYLRARVAATKALEMDNTLAEALTSLAFIRFEYDWDWPGAEKEFKRAIELKPSYTNAHHWYSHYLLAMGRIEESLAESERAVELDPLDPIINVHLGHHYYYARQYERAIGQFGKVLEMNPNYTQAHWRLGLAYEQGGRYAEAVAEFERAMSLSGGDTSHLASLGHAHALAGNKGEAQKVLAELKKQSKRRYVAPYYLAEVHAALNEKDQAMAALEQAYEERFALLAYLKGEPRFDSLRLDPRFQALLRRMGLSPDQEPKNRKPKRENRE